MAWCFPSFTARRSWISRSRRSRCDRHGSEGLVCRGQHPRRHQGRTFFLRVNKTHRRRVASVAQAIGCVRASHQQTLEELFAAKFSEALKTVGKKLEFENLYTQRDDFKDQIIEIIGKDLNGYVLEDAAIDYLEQTPLDSLDKDNILDARGIRKITQITATANIATNDLKQQERMEITRQDLDRARGRVSVRAPGDAEAKAKKEKRSLDVRRRARATKRCA